MRDFSAVSRVAPSSCELLAISPTRGCGGGGGGSGGALVGGAHVAAAASAARARGGVARGSRGDWQRRCSMAAAPCARLWWLT